MLQLIEGVSGSGKTTMLYEKVRALADAKKPCILLVPEQFTSSTENRICRTLGEAASGMVESLSFTSLSERILAACGGVAVRTLTDAGRAVLVRRALAELGENVQYYRRHRRNAAFCQMAAETIDELKSAGLSPDELRRLALGCGAESEKLQELALIYETYQALLGQTGMDPADRLTRAAEQLEKALSEGKIPDFLKDRAVFIDEFDTFNAPKKRLLAAMLAATPAVTVSICSDGVAAEEEDVSLFSGGRRLALELCRLARQAGTGVAAPIVLRADQRHAAAPGLAALADCLTDGLPDAPETSPEAIRLYAAPGREEEARAVAAAIRHLVRDGTPYRKIAVVCRDADTYRAAVRYEFRLAGIPLFCDEATTPAFSAPAGAIAALLDILRGTNFSESMVELAKTGLTELSEREVCALDNYVYTWAPRRSEWGTEFNRAPQGFGEAGHVTEEQTEDVALAEKARAVLVEPVETFCKKAKGADAATVSRALYFCLTQLGAEKSQTEQLAALRAEQGIPAAEEAAREWNVVMELLNQMTVLLGKEVLEPAEYLELFSLLLRTSDLGHIPQTLDSVIFTSAGKMRLDDPDYVFVLGLAEGEFPAAPTETGLLTHADRDALMAQSEEVDLPDCFENRVVREQICFYKAMTAPRRGLWLSWPEGLGLPLTSALAPIAEAFSYRAPTLSPADYAATPAAALDRLGSIWSLDTAETASLYAALEKQPLAADTLALLRKAAAGKPHTVTDLDRMAEALGKRLRISPSQMEKFYSCRYGYFLQYVLGLRPRQQAKLTANQSGSLMHWVLEKALTPDPEPEYAALRPGPLETLDDATVKAIAEALTDAYVKQFMPDDTARFAYLIRRVKRSLTSLLCYIREEQRQSGFKPVACETKIGTHAGELPPQVYQLPGGRCVEVIGAIDRTDAWVDEKGQRWIRVVDYKTGSKTFDLKEVYCGLDCQMLLYLFTLTRDASGRFTGAKPAGVLYLLADPSPKEADRNETAGVPYQLDGIIQDNAAVYEAMDAEKTGDYLPFSFRDGRPSPYQKKKLADDEKLARIEQHLDGLVTNMAEELYAGHIDATPLCTSKHDSCRNCNFSIVCCHEDGADERELDAPEDPFGEPQQPEETQEQEQKGEKDHV